MLVRCWAVALVSFASPVLLFADDVAPTKTANYVIEFVSAEQGGAILAGGDDDVFMSSLYPREAAAMTGIPRGEKTVEEARAAARQFFRASALDFTDREKEQLTNAVRQLDEKFGASYPLLIQRPWKFVKSRRTLCGSFSFTRKDCIIFSEPVVKRIVQMMEQQQERGIESVETLLLHEQMHTLQRSNPELFKPLYESLFSFRQAKVEILPWVDEHQVTNPDGVSSNWVAEVRDGDQLQPYWLGTLLLADKALHRMGRDFETVAIPLTKQDDGTYVMNTIEEDGGVPDYTPLNELKSFTDRFPVSGYDHPNEVAAYIICAVTHGQTKRRLTNEAERVLEASKSWFERNLGPNQEKEPSDEK